MFIRRLKNYAKARIRALTKNCCPHSKPTYSQTGKTGHQIWCPSCGKAAEIQTTFLKACQEWERLF